MKNNTKTVLAYRHLLKNDPKNPNIIPKLDMNLLKISNNPKVIPKNIDMYIEGGENIKIAMIIALKKYSILNNIFLLYLVPRYPIPKVPIILNSPIKDKIIVAVHPPKPLSCI